MDFKTLTKFYAEYKLEKTLLCMKPVETFKIKLPFIEHHTSTTKTNYISPH
jgi:hypothetical protein